MKNPIRGEWWIDDSGTALYADGDLGDMGHEAFIVDALCRRILEAMDIDADECGSLENWDKKIKHKMEEDEFDGDMEEYIEKISKSVWKDPGQRKEAIAIAWGQGDARKYGMEYDGWKRVQGNNIETWELTKDDLKNIGDGIYDASGGEDIGEDETFNIYVFSTKTWYQDVPWSVISEDDPGKLQIYGTKDNPPDAFFAPLAKMTPTAAAHALIVKFGMQAAGWAKTILSNCRSRVAADFWHGVKQETERILYRRNPKKRKKRQH